jgi:hypothetical protein
MVKPKVLQRIEHVFSGSDYLSRQVHSPRPRRKCIHQQALHLGWVPVQNPPPISLNLALIAIVGIAGRGKKITCTQQEIQSKA